MGTSELFGENLTICGGVTCDGLASRPGEVEILPAASCYRKRDKLRHQWALRPLLKASHLCAQFAGTTFTFTSSSALLLDFL